MIEYAGDRYLIGFAYFRIFFVGFESKVEINVPSKQFVMDIYTIEPPDEI